MRGVTNGTEATTARLDSGRQEAQPYMSAPATREPATIAHNVRRPFLAPLNDAQLRMTSGTMKNSVPSATPHRKPSHSGAPQVLARGHFRIPRDLIPCSNVRDIPGHGTRSSFRIRFAGSSSHVW